MSGHIGHDPRRERVARALTAVYAVALGVTVLSWFVDRGFARHVLTLVFGTLNIPASASLVSVVILGLIVGALLRRKQIALALVGVFQLLGALWSALVLWRVLTGTGEAPRGLAVVLGVNGLIAVDIVAVAIALGSLALVWWLRPAFPARTLRGSWWRALAVGAVGTGASLLLARLLLPAQLTGERTSTWRMLRAALRRSLGLEFPRDLNLLAQVDRPVALLLEVLLSLTLVAAVFLFFRSAASASWDGQDEVTLRDLLTRYGEADSLGYFATRRDRSSIFSGDRRAVVSYRVVGAVCLMAGDPIGAPEACPDAVDRWLAHARAYGWVPAATSVGEAGARLLAARGFSVVTLGDEAVLDPDRFRLDSTSMTSVRHAVARARRAGLTVRIRRHADLTPDDLAELAHHADAWRLGGPERGFSMALERLGDPADGRCVLVSAHGPDEAPVAFLSFVPWGRSGLSLDLMRRAPDAPNGVNELMVAELMADAADVGLRRVSLNFAVARGAFAESERLGAGPLTRAGGSLLGVLDRFTQIESLYRNNERYRPSWRPRYVCLAGTLFLPAVAFAIARAEGFVPRLVPRSRRDDRALTAEQLARVADAEARARQAPPPAPRRSDETRHRLRHLVELRAAGTDPYAVGRRHGSRLRDLDADTWRAAAAAGTSLSVSARVRGVRRHGGVVFLSLVDGRADVQAVAEAADLGREGLRLLGRCLDGGDLVVVDAVPGRSRTGTPSLLVRGWTLAAKALHPIPYRGFDDPGARARRRSTDLLVHPRAGELLGHRSAVIRAVRDVLLAERYTEVETPILGTTHGGATARPFRTYANAYGTDLVLRIAPELALKRLLVGDSGPIFEIGRNFRNEGADATHNPEFTVLEAYQPFADYTDMRLLTERIVRAAALAVYGAEVVPLPDAAGGRALVDVSGPWAVVSVCEAVSAAVGERVDQHTDLETLLRLARRHEVHVRDEMGPGAVLEELYGDLVEPATMRPTFYVDFPVETSPLTGPHRSEPGLVERWDLVVGGMELGTAYSELTDPLEQRRRLAEQSWKAAAGDVEAMDIDEDFLHALELGMPPAGGLGIGLDRLVMILTGTTIRDILAFPFVRPRPAPHT